MIKYILLPKPIVRLWVHVGTTIIEEFSSVETHSNWWGQRGGGISGWNESIRNETALRQHFFFVFYKIFPSISILYKICIIKLLNYIKCLQMREKKTKLIADLFLKCRKKRIKLFAVCKPTKKKKRFHNPIAEPPHKHTQNIIKCTILNHSTIDRFGNIWHG